MPGKWVLYIGNSPSCCQGETPGDAVRALIVDFGEYAPPPLVAQTQAVMADLDPGSWRGLRGIVNARGATLYYFKWEVNHG